MSDLALHLLQTFQGVTRPQVLHAQALHTGTLNLRATQKALKEKVFCLSTASSGVTHSAGRLLMATRTQLDAITFTHDRHQDVTMKGQLQCDENQLTEDSGLWETLWGT